MLSTHYRRVALVVMIIFIPPPVLTAALSGLRDTQEADAGLAVVIGGYVGLVEVALATELMARNPSRPSDRGAPAQI